MKLWKVLVPITFVSLIVVLKDSISSFVSFPHNTNGRRRLPGDGNRERRLSPLHVFPREYCGVDNIPKQDGGGHTELGDVSFKKLLKSFHSHPLNTKVIHASSSQLFKDPNMPSNEQGLDDPSRQEQSSEDESKVKLHIPSSPVTALMTPRAPKKLSTLIKISKLDPNLIKEIKKSKYCVPSHPVLLHRSASNGSGRFVSFFSNADIFSPFIKGSQRIWGRTGKRNINVHFMERFVSLFEMGTNTAPPVKFKNQNMEDISNIRKMFTDAVWNIHVKVSGQLMKIGDDPSEVMTLWTVTSEKVRKIDLSAPEVLEKLDLQTGDLIVAIPTQLNDLMEVEVKAGTPYSSVVRLIREFVDYERDQLIVVIRI